MSERDLLVRDIHAFIERVSPRARDKAQFESLYQRVRAYQERTIPALARLMKSARDPALPSDIFRFTRVASFDEEENVQEFISSGTTASDRSHHHFKDLSLYDAAAERFAKEMLFDDDTPVQLVVVAPSPEESPHSSLSYMLGRFADWFGSSTTFCVSDDALNAGLLERILDEAIEREEPVVLLGTSFGFVHAEDALDRSFVLPTGSRVMQTGGFKGRSREFTPEEMRGMISSRYGVPTDAVIAEYGMTELSSQLYETSWVSPGEPRRLVWPAWVRVRLVDPEDMSEREDEGLVRIDDLANVDSCVSIQTSDRAKRVEDGIVLLGRAPFSVTRGCSVALDIALGKGSRGEG